MTDQKLMLVTGGAGFIGSHLCARLVKEGHRVISLDNYFTGSRENHVPGVEYREGHTKDIEKHVSETPDLIYHLGEYSRVEQSLLEPDVVHDLNVVGTSAVLKFWQKLECKLVYAGSSTKFGDGGLARETTPYASTKAMNSELVQTLGEKYGLPYAITYFYNVYGPGERAGTYGTVIETFKRMYLTGAPMAVVAPGTQTRNFTHVEDITDGLMLVGAKGLNDEYGLGSEKRFEIRDVAKLFGGDIVMIPSRAGNRMASTLDTTKARALGWAPKHDLEEYIDEFKAGNPRGKKREKRILVLSTTFYPVVGPAEDALIELMRKIPDVEFDVVTSAFSPGAGAIPLSLPNVHVHQVGFGRSSDKFFLPVLGFRTARNLQRKHSYLFAWSIMASYAALAGVLIRRIMGVPLLITLADQDLASIPLLTRFIVTRILSDADQVYGANTSQEKHAAALSRSPLRRSIGEGDAFANQLRYAYAEILLNRQKTNPTV